MVTFTFNGRKYDLQNLTQAERKSLKEDLVLLWNEEIDALKSKFDINEIPGVSAHEALILQKVIRIATVFGKSSVGNKYFRSCSYKDMNIGQDTFLGCAMVTYRGTTVFLAANGNPRAANSVIFIYPYIPGDWEGLLDEALGFFCEELRENKTALRLHFGSPSILAFSE